MYQTHLDIVWSYDLDVTTDGYSLRQIITSIVIELWNDDNVTTKSKLKVHSRLFPVNRCVHRFSLEAHTPFC